MESHLGRSAPVPRIVVVTGFFGSALVFAAGIAILAWQRLPYERLERHTPEQQFIVWEGVVWLFALLLTFLGLSMIFERAGWRLGVALREVRRRLKGRVERHPIGPEVVPWWMLTAGTIFMVIGAVARATLAP